MTGVLDGSAALEISLEGDDSDRVANIVQSADWIISPDLLVSEVTNAFWKYHQFENLPLDICERALEKTLLLVDDFIGAFSLHKEAFGLACLANHSVYDMMYLVLARRENGILITVDQKLKKLARKYSIKTISDLR